LIAVDSARWQSAFPAVRLAARHGLPFLIRQRDVVR
jgi:hypothetical protein